MIEIFDQYAFDGSDVLGKKFQRHILWIVERNTIERQQV